MINATSLNDIATEFNYNKELNELLENAKREAEKGNYGYETILNECDYEESEVCDILKILSNLGFKGEYIHHSDPIYEDEGYFKLYIEW